MAIGNRLRLIGVAIIAFSIYIGLEIDYRHWTWLVFLIFLPAALVALLVLTRDKPPSSDAPG